eukprot:gene7257-5104_t
MPRGAPGDAAAYAHRPSSSGSFSPLAVLVLLVLYKRKRVVTQGTQLFVVETMDGVPKILFYVFCFRMLTPFYQHRYKWFPLFFLLMGCSVVSLVCLLGMIGNRENQLVQLAAQGSGGKNRFVTVPQVPELYLLTNISMSTIALAGILCCLLWAQRGCIACCQVYFIPMLRDLSLIEDALWKDETSRARASGDEECTSVTWRIKASRLRELTHSVAFVCGVGLALLLFAVSLPFLFLPFCCIEPSGSKPSQEFGEQQPRDRSPPCDSYSNYHFHYSRAQSSECPSLHDEPAGQATMLNIRYGLPRHLGAATALLDAPLRHSPPFPSPSSLSSSRYESSRRCCCWAIHPTHRQLLPTPSHASPSKRFKKRSLAADPFMSSGRSAAAWNTVGVFHEPGKPLLSLELCLLLPETQYATVPLIKSMAREAGSVAQQTLERIRLLLAPPASHAPREPGKKAKSHLINKEERLQACPPVVALGDGEGPDLVPLDPEMKNSDFWARAKVLRVGTTDATVMFNCPMILSIQPLPVPYVGSPLLCIDMRVMAVGEYEVAYQWTCEETDSGERKVYSTDPIFVPPPELAFKVLTLRVSVDPGHQVWEEIRTERVRQAQERMERWDQTALPAEPPAFRVVSYNILYDGFCTNNFGKRSIYPFCTEDMLNEKQRAMRLRRELLEYHADIICLQECGHRIFNNFLAPSFRLCGYEAAYFSKSGRTSEGCGYLLRRSRFDILSRSCLPLNMDTLARRHPALAAEVSQHAELSDALQHMTAVSTAVRLMDRATGRRLVVGNTHLFFHADACHLRLLQGFMHLHHLSEVACQPTPAGQEGVPPDPVVFCGDCNCTHATGAYALFTTGRVGAEHRSWAKGKRFWWGCDKKLGDDMCGEGEAGAAADEDEVAASRPAPPPPPFGEKFFATTLTAPLALADAYAACPEPLPWTNYAKNFKEVVDYILYTPEQMKVVQAVPIPPESELNRNCALPNDKYASDHVALIADLQFLTGSCEKVFESAALSLLYCGYMCCTNPCDSCLRIIMSSLCTSFSPSRDRLCRYAMPAVTPDPDPEECSPVIALSRPIPLGELSTPQKAHTDEGNQFATPTLVMATTSPCSRSGSFRRSPSLFVPRHPEHTAADSQSSSPRIPPSSTAPAPSTPTPHCRPPGRDVTPHRALAEPGACFTGFPTPVKISPIPRKAPAAPAAGRSPPPAVRCFPSLPRDDERALDDPSTDASGSSSPEPDRSGSGSGSGAGHTPGSLPPPTTPDDSDEVEEDRSSGSSGGAGIHLGSDEATCRPAPTISIRLDSLWGRRTTSRAAYSPGDLVSVGGDPAREFTLRSGLSTMLSSGDATALPPSAADTAAGHRSTGLSISHGGVSYQHGCTPVISQNSSTSVTSVPPGPSGAAHRDTELHTLLSSITLPSGARSTPSGSSSSTVAHMWTQGSESQLSEFETAIRMAATGGNFVHRPIATAAKETRVRHAELRPLPTTANSKQCTSATPYDRELGSQLTDTGSAVMNLTASSTGGSSGAAPRRRLLDERGADYFEEELSWVTTRASRLTTSADTSEEGGTNRTPGKHVPGPQPRAKGTALGAVPPWWLSALKTEAYLNSIRDRAQQRGRVPRASSPASRRIPQSGMARSKSSGAPRRALDTFLNLALTNTTYSTPHGSRRGSHTRLHGFDSVKYSPQRAGLVVGIFDKAASDVTALPWVNRLIIRVHQLAATRMFLVRTGQMQILWRRAIILVVLVLISFTERSSGSSDFFMSSRITQLNDYSLHTYIQASHKPVVILFYAPWCGHCQKFKDEYRRLGAILGDSVRLGAVDGDEYSQLAHEFNVKGFPTILYYPMGTKTHQSKPEEYQGPRTASAIQKFIISRIKTDKVISATTAEDVKKVVADADYKMAAVFFSSRAKPPPMMSVMSYSKPLEGLPFVFVSKDNSESVGKEFNVTDIPTVSLIQLQGEVYKTLIFTEHRMSYGGAADFFRKQLRKAKNSGESTETEGNEKL